MYRHVTEKCQEDGDAGICIMDMQISIIYIYGLLFRNNSVGELLSFGSLVMSNGAQ